MAPKYKVPAELEESRVLLGSNWLGKKVFNQGSGIGEISQMLTGWPADREHADLMVPETKESNSWI